MELASYHLIERGTNVFPLEVTAELLGSWRRHLNSTQTEDTAFHSPAIFFHALAIMHTPQYRTENAGALHGDWPRIPLPATAELLTQSATLGRQLAELLDPESEIKLLYPECDTGFPLVWRFFGSLKLPKPSDLSENLKLTAGWGRRGQGSTVMPGTGQSTTRPWTEAERTHLQWIGEYFHLTLDQVLNLSAEATSTSSSTAAPFWSSIPANVWTYPPGGYQVLKKWLI